MARTLLLVNCNSRTGRESLEQCIEGLRNVGINPVCPECGSKDELASLILQYGPEVDSVVVAGGDGTLNAAATALVQVKRPLGIIPTGTANDLARTLGLPTEIDAAIRVVSEGHSTSVDLGYVNDHPFFNVASIGMSVDLAKELTGDVKRRFGRLGYAIAAASVLVKARPFRADVLAAGQMRSALTLQVAVGNGRYYGGGNIVERSASIEDGSLDLYSLEFLKAWWLLLMFPAFRRGEHDRWEGVRSLRASEVEIRTRRPKPVNADGEIVTGTPAKFRISRGALNVFTPKDEPTRS